MSGRTQVHVIALCRFLGSGSLPVIFYRNPVVLSQEEVREALYAMRYLGTFTSDQIGRVELKGQAEALQDLTNAAQALFESPERISRGLGQARETLEKLLLLPDPNKERTELELSLRTKGLGRLLAAFSEERQKMLRSIREHQAA